MTYFILSSTNAPSTIGIERIFPSKSYIYQLVCSTAKCRRYARKRSTRRLTISAQGNLNKKLERRPEHRGRLLTKTSVRPNDALRHPTKIRFSHLAVSVPYQRANTPVLRQNKTTLFSLHVFMTQKQRYFHDIFHFVFHEPAVTVSVEWSSPLGSRICRLVCSTAKCRRHARKRSARQLTTSAQCSLNKKLERPPDHRNVSFPYR